MNKPTFEEERIKDLEAEVKSLKELLHAETKMEEVNELKNIFVATASHQLRTPLSVMKWVLSVLQTDPDLVKMESKIQMINQAYQGLERAIDTVNDLINFTRIEDGRLPITYQEADLAGIIAKSVDWSKKVAESRQITFSVNVQEDLPKFQFDPLLITEVVENMINNALDYNVSPGEVEVAAKVSTDGKRVEVSVTNTGVGVSEVDSKNIFMPFFRSEPARQVHPDGSGLGLYLSKYIVKEHKGTLTFVSEPNKKTTFTMALPFEQTDPSAQAAA